MNFQGNGHSKSINKQWAEIAPRGLIKFAGELWTHSKGFIENCYQTSELLPASFGDTLEASSNIL